MGVVREAMGRCMYAIVKEQKLKRQGKCLVVTYLWYPRGCIGGPEGKVTSLWAEEASLGGG